MSITARDEFDKNLSELGDFWEHIDFPNGVSVGPGRNKSILWERYLSKSVEASNLEGKSVLDIGCNAGGNLVEIAKSKPSRLVGLEANTTFFNQAKFVVEEFQINADVFQYKISPNKSSSEYQADLGYFDVIFMLGVVYHLDRKTNVGILKYIKQNCQTSYFSSQLFSTDQRAGVDWELTKEGHLDLFKEAGFSDLKTIYEKKESDDWSGLTNQWYFEAT